MSEKSQLINEQITLPVAYSINPQAEQDASALALRGAEVALITSAETNTAAGAVVRDIRKYCNEVETMRTTLTKPLLDAQRLLKRLADEHCAPLLAEQKRIERMATAFLELENKRVADEQKKQREEFEAAQRRQFELDDAARLAAQSGSAIDKLAANRKLEAAKAQVQAVIAAPEPEAARASGQQMKKVLKWEVTDLMLLVKHNPQLCKIEPKASAINSTCHPNLEIPGLRCWYENVSIFTT